ncbi:MAG TPA: 4Fe-4S dicluster domain-containing protein [Syntrophorhabdus sp.]|nr:4Fe-4S dicluster domain-containing protein [Syntrophorhabdus sp.]HNY69891.1 4Fe-4S dicluster domain-containing protein [Syntrophorhabdus sp.]HOH26126.1 4Fe-4S dicluster domain-containing protein [Syntrophorhabdus sp.]HPB37935.1 4Fe-4S dicluster domain-containing protein [Syntrophorhabdus sp.]HQB34068.1 4Fe-4S dicluster domain-containing protein [Syntrophorhabdus sp.]
MDTLNLTKSLNLSFIEQVSKESGQNPSLCYQCGNCTAGCPYTHFFDYPVSQIMRLLQAGQRDTILSSKAIWLCATCETCTTRCPCEIDVAMIMDTLRIIARRENKVSEKDVKLFYDSFLNSMKEHGRLFEVGTLLSYNLRSGNFFADADLGPKVLEKGKIHFLPRKIKGRDKVAKIFTRFQEKAKKHG